MKCAVACLAAQCPRYAESVVFLSGSGGRAHRASAAVVGNDDIRTLGLTVELAPRGRADAFFLMENSFVTSQTIAVDGGLTLVS
jgi:hypothetical protein